jgi:hypothetical protein
MAAGNLSGTAAEPNTRRVLILARKDASALAALRLSTGVEVAEIADAIWVRVNQADVCTEDRLRQLPAIERYDWLEGDGLRRCGSLIPCEVLPPLAWQTVASWLMVSLPPPALAAERRLIADQPILGADIPIKLVRSTLELPANALLTTVEHWIRFGAEAPEIRLRGLRFAVNHDGEALIVGEPLPPLPGTQYYVRDGIAVPAGFAWDPAVEVEVVRRRLGVSVDCLVLFYQDGTFSLVLAEQWVYASRSAIRATDEVFERRS